MANTNYQNGQDNGYSQENLPGYNLQQGPQYGPQRFIQFDQYNRPFYLNEYGYATYCDMQGNPVEFDATGHQVFYDSNWYPFYYAQDGQAYFYDQSMIQYDRNGYLILQNLYGIDQTPQYTPPQNYNPPNYGYDQEPPEPGQTETPNTSPAEEQPAGKKGKKNKKGLGALFGKKKKEQATEQPEAAEQSEPETAVVPVENGALVPAGEAKTVKTKKKLILPFGKKMKESAETVEKQVFVTDSVNGEHSDADLSGTIDYLNEAHPRSFLGKFNQAAKNGKVKKPKKTPKEKVASNRSAKALKKKAKVLKVPRTVQDTIPYLAVYPDDGIIEIEQGVFTKSYELQDVNYSIAKQAEQEEMFTSYASFLNTFDPTVRVEITINQRSVNMEDFEQHVLLKMKNDNLDELRRERNDMLRKRISEGKNNLIIEKYCTISIKAPDINQARVIFSRYDNTLPTNIRKIGNAEARPLKTAERLEILHDIYNQDSVGLFGNNQVLNEKGDYVFDSKEKFSFSIMQRMGLTTKDCVGPESFQFKDNYGKVGNKFFRALFLRSIPSFLGDSILADLTNTDCNMLTSLHYQPIEAEKAIKMARAQVVNINANVIDKQKQASKSGYSPDLINPELMNAANEAGELVQDLTRKNQKLFMLTFVIVHFADTLEDLNNDTEAIKTIGRRFVLDIRPLSWQQENGLATALPLANNQLAIKRSLTSESAAIFMPFVNQELRDRNGGMYYGNNAVSHNMILLNRRNSKNGNGFIFGTPGSGKSMSAKQEMLTVLLSSNDDVLVIDPEGEYYPMAEMLGGEVIRIAAGGDNHINPMDINLYAETEDDPVTMKSDFIVSLCEVICGGVMGLNATQRSIIDRCVKIAYEPLLKSYNPNTKKYDESKMPTLVEFWQALKTQNGYDAMQLAESLEIYVKGTLNVFAHKTNVKYSERFVVYDIREIGNTMKAMGLLVVLDNIWNRIVEGREKGKNVWFFIDEIYLLFKTDSSAEFLRNLYKRARKYGGLPTGITQNVSDLLESDIARTMISNSEYIQMLNQAPLDRAQLSELLNISPAQMNFITNADPGTGLIYDGAHIVPFVNKLPKETKQYQAMTTKLSEVKAREEQKAAEAARQKNQAQGEIPRNSRNQTALQAQ